MYEFLLELRQGISHPHCQCVTTVHARCDESHCLPSCKKQANPMRTNAPCGSDQTMTNFKSLTSAGCANLFQDNTTDNHHNHKHDCRSRGIRVEYCHAVLSSNTKYNDARPDFDTARQSLRRTNFHAGATLCNARSSVDRSAKEYRLKSHREKHGASFTRRQ